MVKLIPLSTSTICLQTIIMRKVITQRPTWRSTTTDMVTIFTMGPTDTMNTQSTQIKIIVMMEKCPQEELLLSFVFVAAVFLDSSTGSNCVNLSDASTIEVMK